MAELVGRNATMAKAIETTNNGSVNYKISLPANMVKALGITVKVKTVLVEVVGEKEL